MGPAWSVWVGPKSNDTRFYETRGGGPCEDTGRGWSWTATSLGMLEEAGKRSPPRPSEGRLGGKGVGSGCGVMLADVFPILSSRWPLLNPSVPLALAFRKYWTTWTKPVQLGDYSDVTSDVVTQLCLQDS